MVEVCELWSPKCGRERNIRKPILQMCRPPFNYFCPCKFKQMIMGTNYLEEKFIEIDLKIGLNSI